MLIVMRHGPWDHKEDCLKDEGWKKAKEVANNLPSFKRVIVSPKKRCRDTARALGFENFEIDPRLGELFPDEDAEFSKLSKEIGAFEALFSKSEWRRTFEEKIYSLLSWILSLRDDVLFITHGEVLCGLFLVLEGKRNWTETEWENHLFPPFGVLKIR